MCVSRVVLWVSLKYQVENLSCYCLVVAHCYTPLFMLKAKKIIKLQLQTKNSRKIFQWLNCTQKLHYKMVVFETEEGFFYFIFWSQKCRKLLKLTFYNYGSWYYVSIEVNKPGAVSNNYCLTDWFLMYCSFHWETFSVKIYSLRWKRRLFIVFSVWWTKDSWTCDLDWTSFWITSPGPAQISSS